MFRIVSKMPHSKLVDGVKASNAGWVGTWHRIETAHRITENKLRNFPVLEPESSVICPRLFLSAIYLVPAIFRQGSPVSFADWPPNTRARVKTVRAAAQVQSNFISLTNNPLNLISQKVQRRLMSRSVPERVWICSGENETVSHS